MDQLQVEDHIDLRAQRLRLDKAPSVTQWPVAVRRECDAVTVQNRKNFME
ncbi:hypothetical protein ACFQ9Q_41555 [Streptomyces virginiae]